MYILEKTFTISAAHKLNLPYTSKCKQLHGHNYTITVKCCADELDENGMVIDFSVIKSLAAELDHAYLNDVMDVNPTAENIAKWVFDKLPAYKCTSVTVEETDGNKVMYYDFADSE